MGERSSGGGTKAPGGLDRHGGGENRKMGLHSPVVLDQSFSAGSAFGASGTPSAILVDEEGKVASELRVGAPGVFALAGARQAEV